MSNCIFCKIVSKEIKSSVVYEDDHVIAFNDINPQAKVHVLIVPKKHCEDVSRIDDDKVFAQVYHAANAVAKKLGIDKSGYRVVTNAGPDATQTVFHVHF